MEEKIDLFGQRFIEIWSGLPVLYLLLLLSLVSLNLVLDSLVYNAFIQLDVT